jgi:kinesin family protein 11
MLSGYNCTIFAYGQTGTGKTYTMSGDLTETMGMLSDNAGIIPRVLQALFKKLELDEQENSVRCSFIELYNEDLRDLLSSDDSPKLKIYDDTSRKGHSTTMVQGMEERYILNAGDGLKWLREGSVKRQVAATKCNDLSSRSHTVFTITVYAKHKTDKESGEDFLMLGKLNLVDLAGSENIQRSGAENKRAAEAGLINKSLLTLGRVINALVDRSPHIPYRESKLTRLLQDSLGGRTKTCIIATISPAKSNLEETISTLDYAFRAKNIRNKPQLNALTSKKMLLRDFTVEIERIKAELIATRQRNGVYLSNDMYEELTVQNESRRILTEEQGAKIETLESNLKNKLQELLSLTSNFMGLKKEHDGTLAQFDEAKEVLDQTEIVLAATRKSLVEETHIRKAHQTTEEQLAAVGGDLLSTLERTVGDIDCLHAKNRRKSELQNLNRSTWNMSQARVADITELVEGRIEEFRQGQEEHISSVSQRMQTFVKEELEKLSTTQTFLDDNLAHFAESRTQLVEQQERSKEDMDSVLEEIKVVRDNVKQRVGESLQAIAAAAERIAGDVLSELGTFHSQLHTSYSSLGKDFKSVFEELLRHVRAQKAESDRLRHELEEATHAVVESNESVSTRLQEVLDEERAQAAAERQALLSQITRLINSQAELQESRLADKAALLQETIQDSNKTLGGSVSEYSAGMAAWSEKDSQVMEDVASSRDALKTRLKDDWTVGSLPIRLMNSLTVPDRKQAQHVDPGNHKVGPRGNRAGGGGADPGPRRPDAGSRRLCVARQVTQREPSRAAHGIRAEPEYHCGAVLLQHLRALQGDVRPGTKPRRRGGCRHQQPQRRPRAARPGHPPAAGRAQRGRPKHGAARIRADGRDPAEGQLRLPHRPAAHRGPRRAARRHARVANTHQAKPRRPAGYQPDPRAIPGPPHQPRQPPVREPARGQSQPRDGPYPV